MTRSVCIVLAICCVFFLCACGNSSKTPFDKLLESKAETPEEIIKAYSEDYSYLSNTDRKYGNFLNYDEYSWLGMKGQLVFNFYNFWETYNSDFWTLENAKWVYKTDNPESAAKKIISAMNREMGEAEREDGAHVWMDKIFPIHYYLYVNNESVILVAK